MSKPTCESCGYYDRRDAECRRNPPEMDGNGHAEWPVVGDNDWCGSHRPRNNEAGSVTTISRDGVMIEDWPKGPKPDGNVVFVSEAQSMSKELWDKLKV